MRSCLVDDIGNRRGQHVTQRLRLSIATVAANAAATGLLYDELIGNYYCSYVRQALLSGNDS
jgi:hypothetical protein